MPDKQERTMTGPYAWWWLAALFTIAAIIGAVVSGRTARNRIIPLPHPEQEPEKETTP
jgi:hypothetical protein